MAAQLGPRTAPHVNHFSSTHFGGSPDERPVITPSTAADRSATGMTAPARSGPGNTGRDTLIRAGSRTLPSSRSRTGTIVGSTPPIVPSADTFDFDTFSGTQDSLSLPDAVDIDADPAADDSCLSPRQPTPT
jgi:hypothetical protein